MVTFREAIFEHFCVSSLVPNGDSASVTLSSVYDTHDAYLGFTLCTLRRDDEDPAGGQEYTENG
jgi:hypothetical protein